MRGIPTQHQLYPTEIRVLVNQLTIGALVIASFFLYLPATLQAQDQSLDQQLFEDLDDELFSDLPPIEKESPKAKSDIDQQLQRDLGGEDLGRPSASNPLKQLAETMKQVRRRLQTKDLATETQQIQGRIVSDLDKLIDQLKKQQQQQQQSGGSQQKQQQQSAKQSKQQQSRPGNQPGNKPSNQPANDSSSRLGNAESAEVSGETQDKIMQDAWGNLPASVQKEMQSARPEKFLPKYSRLIEQYFKRLAEEQRK